MYLLEAQNSEGEWHEFGSYNAGAVSSTDGTALAILACVYAVVNTCDRVRVRNAASDRVLVDYDQYNARYLLAVGVNQRDLTGLSI